MGSRLYVRGGDPAILLPEIFDELGVTHLTFDADETGEPYAARRDETVTAAAERAGIVVRTFRSETLHALSAYVAKAGGSSADKIPKTMGAFQKLLGSMGSVAKPLDAPKAGDFPNQDHGEYDGTMLPPKGPIDLPWPHDVAREDVSPIWGPEDCENLTPIVRGGESHGLAQMTRSMKRPTWVASFDKPKTSCTSLSPSTTVLSPYLSLGCVSPRLMWRVTSEAISRAPANATKTKPPVSLHGQLLWRDFNNLIAHAANAQNPGCWGKMDGNPYCRQVPWSADDKLLAAWKAGRTGYPWIDACMVQLRTEGWIHHLGRHAVACFLTRGDLWQSWEDGAEHFESQLLDADYALNGFNWLWLSCSGFFYQYFRCYSPVAFQKKNDPTGAYIRKWLPVLSRLPDKYIYEPFKAPLSVQKAAGIEVGRDYPKPIIDHAYESKENMSKMAYAYDQHKLLTASEVKSSKNKAKKQQGGKVKKQRKLI